MRFEWDERKRRAKIAKHGLDFRRAVHVFDGASFTYSSSTQDEARWVTIGEAHDRLVAVVWTRRSGAVRVISMRGRGVKKDGDIVSYTAEELRVMIERGQDETDWARVDAMTEAELEAAIASDPDWADIPRDWYKHATPRYPEALRKEVRLRLDPDLLAWFKRQGPGYQARINAALRAFVQAHESVGRE